MNFSTKTGITIQSAITSAPNYAVGTGVTAGDVSRWNASSRGRDSVKEFDIELLAASTVSLTNAELWGISLEENSFVDKTISAATNAAETLTITSHGFRTGQGPVRVASSADDLPLGLDADTDYWVIVVDANTIQLAASLVDAFAETAVTFDDDGSGTLTLSDGADGEQSYAAKVLSYGLLGIANDGAVDLDTYQGYTTRINHRPRTVAYFMSATFGAAVATTVTVHPVLED